MESQKRCSWFSIFLSKSVLCVCFQDSKTQGRAGSKGGALKDANEQRRKQKRWHFCCKLNVPQARHTAKAWHEHVKAFLTFSPGHQMAHREVLKKKKLFPPPLPLWFHQETTQPHLSDLSPQPGIPFFSIKTSGCLVKLFLLLAPVALLALLLHL